MKKFNCLIVDDDEVARLKVVSIVRNFPIFNIIGNFSSAIAAFSVSEKESIDVLFLDIDMPTLSGLELRKKLMNIPVCVFITSHPEHAAESFELETLDFIVKPLREERFAQTVSRIEEFMEIKQKAVLYETSFGDDFIYIKDGYEKVKVKLHDILYIEALKDYCILVTSYKRYCVFSSIGNLIKESHFSHFIRIHRSYAVQKQFVEKVSANEITLLSKTKLPVGNSFKNNTLLI
ncbi:LytR/AlgR family response regulator transcription factor [Flavobacterium sp.]|uniref:LytR/AlgR family response regulator transcription factor n=1 Tax=Flavobacterium sp. TaxID=239 RepID=UPI0035B1A4F4